MTTPSHTWSLTPLPPLLRMIPLLLELMATDNAISRALCAVHIMCKLSMDSSNDPTPSGPQRNDHMCPQATLLLKGSASFSSPTPTYHHIYPIPGLRSCLKPTQASPCTFPGTVSQLPRLSKGRVAMGRTGSAAYREDIVPAICHPMP